MKRVWPIIGVRDVAASSRFYQALFGQSEREPDHQDFDQILDTDETVLVCLHEWGGHGEGPPLRSPGREAPGNGLLLFFRVDDFDDALIRARGLVSHFEEEPAVNEDGPGTMEFKLRDPDGYYVSISSL